MTDEDGTTKDDNAQQQKSPHISWRCPSCGQTYTRGQRYEALNHLCQYETSKAESDTAEPHPYATAVQVSITEIARLNVENSKMRAALEKAEAAMRMHGWQLISEPDAVEDAEAFAAWEAVDETLHPDEIEPQGGIKPGDGEHE